MSNTPHQLAADFPNLADKISDLKAADPHFAHMMQEYDALNDQVHLAETDVQPMEDLALTELRKKRMRLKDEIYKALTTMA